jgi:hypothetical protein
MFEDGSGGVDATRSGRSEPTVDRLDTELNRTDLARHLAFFFRSPERQREVAATFVDHVLENGERCLYFVDQNTPAAIRTTFEAVGVDVGERTAAGDLVVREGTAAYRAADFDPERLVADLETVCEETVAAGYEGLAIAGETTWCFHTDLSHDHVVDFEAAFDAAVPDLPVTALCQYDLNRFGESSVAKALWTHEQIIYRDTVCENPYYVPPDRYRSSAERQLNAQLMLEQTHTLTQARRQLDRREQRLAVVNRVLRHNIRNDLNVVRGLVSHVIDRGDLCDDDRERLETVIRRADEVVDIAEKARYVQRTVDEAVVRRTTLDTPVTAAVERIADRHPDAAVRLRGDDRLDQSVIADANLDTALVELLQYGIDERTEPPRTVTLTVGDRSTETAHVDVEYPDGPVPPRDRQVLDRGLETQLEHCRGLGLWLAKWIVGHAHGRLRFPEDDADLRVELRRAGG